MKQLITLLLSYQKSVHSILHLFGSQCSSVNIQTGRTTGVQFPGGAMMGYFSVRHRVHTGLRGPRSLLSIHWVPGVNHLLLSSAEVKNA